jgi:hypothetical protein
MCSILWWILYTWEALGSIFFKFEPWFMHWQQGGQRKVEKSYLASLEPIPIAKGELVHFFCILGFWGCGLCEIGLTGLENRSDRFWWNRSDRFWEPAWPVVPRFGTCSGGACICAWGALVCFGGLCSLLEHGFVSNVSSRCPCIRGPRHVFFKWSCSLPFSAFDRLLEFFFLFVFFSVSFSLCLPNVCVVNALIKGEIEDHVSFEDRWMVASLCDEW